MGECTYDITVQTSDSHKHAGTNATVSVNLVGEDGESTGYLTLDKFLKNDFERGQIDTYKIRAKNVGLPIIVKIKLSHFLIEDQWYCDIISICIEGNSAEKAVFPVYDWVEGDVDVPRGDGFLPQKITNPLLTKLRKEEVTSNKKTFEWLPAPKEGDIGYGFPRYVNASWYPALPSMFKRSEARQKNYLGNILGDLLSFTTNLLKEKAKPIENLDSFHSLYDDDALKRPGADYLEDWQSDEAMGNQVLNGINPLMVSKCTSLPNYCNVTNDDVSKFLSSGKTLHGEIAAGKIYISDYNAILADAARNNSLDGDQLHCANAVGLFYVNSEGKFLPIAIQLEPNDRDYLFTPDDSHHDWLLAKMYFRCASSVVHEWIFHYLLTHSFVEPFAVALFRCFPRCHPIYKLMRPHLQTVSGMNSDARIILLPPISLPQKVLSVSAADLARKQYKIATFDDLVIPKRLKRQGTDDVNLLPNYHYRDDALLLWKVIGNYVTNVICHYYKSDTDVSGDFELQDWAQDVAKNGLGWQDNNTRGMPENITTIDQLIEICLTVIFTSSAQHAAVNFGQYETYKFVPNSPVGMRMPPHKKGEANDERIINSLPNAFQGSTNVALAHVLSDFAPNEKFLGEYPQKLFTEDAIQKFQQDYRDELVEVSKKMKERNSSLKYHYIYLMPEHVPNSIAI